MTERKTPSNNRDETDRSLREERAKTDDELAKRRAGIEREADAVVDRAERRADAVLARARETANEKLERSSATPAELDAVARERATEDVALAGERSAAQEQLLRERAERAELMTELLLLERTRTDERLAIERADTDAELTTRDDFLGIVSHDLRSLLSGVNMSAWAILQRVREDPALSSVRDEAARTQRYVARMNRLVGDLLDVVSIDAGRLAVVPAEANAVKLVRETVEQFRPVAAAQRVELTANVTGGSLPARLDSERIMQVLANLVANALKFTHEGGSITVGVRAVDGAVEFSVRDTGRGIPSDKLQAIFDRFAKANTDRRGFGLGLYISRSIVEAHAGRMWVESKLGEGTTFTFTLPVRE